MATTTTTVKNISGGTRTFSMLPPFGVRLEDNEEYDIDGDIYMYLNTSRRRLQAFQRAVAEGRLEIVARRR